MSKYESTDGKYENGDGKSTDNTGKIRPLTKFLLVSMFSASLFGAFTTYNQSKFIDREILKNRPKFVETRLEEKVRKECEQDYEKATDRIGIKMDIHDKFVVLSHDGHSHKGEPVHTMYYPEYHDNLVVVDHAFRGGASFVFSEQGVFYYDPANHDKTYQETASQKKRNLIDVRPYMSSFVIYELKDVNKDGLPDIIVTSYNWRKEVHYFENKGSENVAKDKQEKELRKDVWAQ